MTFLCYDIHVRSSAAKSCASAYGALLGRVFPDTPSSPTSGAGAASFAVRAESCAVQCVFDLTLALGVFKRSGVAVEPLEELSVQLRAWEERVGD